MTRLPPLIPAFLTSASSTLRSLSGRQPQHKHHRSSLLTRFSSTSIPINIQSNRHHSSSHQPSTLQQHNINITMDMKRPFTICIEGNIGSGKTSLIEYFEREFKDMIFPVWEPIDLWRNVDGHNLFHMTAKDPAKYAFPFQQFIQLTMSECHHRPAPLASNGVQYKTKMMERSLYSARYCFVENLKKNNIITDVEYSVYDRWYEFLTRDPRSRVDLILYVKASPEVCYDRIMSRNRKEESSISLETLKTLDNLHNDWLLNPHGKKAVAPVMVIPGDPNKMDMVSVFNTIRPYVLAEKVWNRQEVIPLMEHNSDFSLKCRQQNINPLSGLELMDQENGDHHDQENIHLEVNSI